MKLSFPQRTFYVARLLLTAGLIVGLLIFIPRTLDFDALRETLRDAQYLYLLPSTLINLVVLGNIVLRWWTLLDYRARYRDCFAANQIGGYLNTLLPMRMGDFARSYLLKRHAPQLSMVAILSSIGAELTFDMVVLMSLLAVMLLTLSLPPLLMSAGALLAVLTLVAATGIFMLTRGGTWIDRLAARLPGRMGGVAGGIIHRIRDGLSSLRSNRQFALILLITIMGYTIQVGANWFLLRVFVEDVPIQAGLVVLVGSGMGLALPLLPSAAGTYELAVVLALSTIGISAEEGAAVAVTLHAQQLSITFVTGLFFMVVEGVSVQELRQAKTQTPPS